MKKQRRQTPNQVSAAVGYKLWAATYDTDPNPLLTLETRTLAGKLDNLQGKVFLDVGCGTARSMVFAAQRGAQVFGVDFVLEMLTLARKKSPAAGRLVQADGSHMPFKNEFADITLCSFAVGYIPDPECLLREMGRVTKRHGIAIISDLHPTALAAGWRRTFRWGATLFEIENHAHTLEELVRAGRSGHFELREVLEPYFESPEISIMREAGKSDQIKEVLKFPALLVQLWERC